MIQRSGEIYLPLRFVLESCGWRGGLAVPRREHQDQRLGLDVMLYPDGGRVIYNGLSRPETLQLLMKTE